MVAELIGNAATDARGAYPSRRSSSRPEVSRPPCDANARDAPEVEAPPAINDARPSPPGPARAAVTIRDGHPGDAGVPDLLYLSSAPLYDTYAGSPERARRLLALAYRRGGHSASHDVCRVAETEGTAAGVLAGFRVDGGSRLARRFVSITLRRMPPSQWAAARRVLRATDALVADPPPGTFYIDALAVADQARGRGVARALLHDAEGRARLAGCTALALETQLDNHGAQRVYERFGFRQGAHYEAEPEVARLLGTPGYMAYVKELPPG
jgi:ribosomal protein S18 acetylase RimI-like enzyme